MNLASDVTQGFVSKTISATTIAYVHNIGVLGGAPGSWSFSYSILAILNRPTEGGGGGGGGGGGVNGTLLIYMY